MQIVRCVREMGGIFRDMTKNTEEKEQKVSIADQMGEEMIAEGQFNPLPGETALDMWTRLSAKALQMTMIRAATGDRQALSTMYEMVKAPVLAETSMLELETKGGRLRSLTSSKSRSQGLVNDAARALIDGSVSTAK